MEGLNPRWQEATKELIKKFEEFGENLRRYKTLEIFGGTGNWHTKVFADKVKSLEVWEIQPELETELRKNLPNSTIKIVNSIKHLHSNELEKFELILIDNPMNVFGEDGKNEEYCEHFDVLTKIDRIIDERAIVVFNVNRHPFHYEKFPRWKKRREEFYGMNETNDISVEFLLKFYDGFFKDLGFKIKYRFKIIRVFFNEIDMTYYFAYNLLREKN